MTLSLTSIIISDRDYNFKEVFRVDFQRIDKNTVQCRMTEEEMNSYGFAIEDFFTNQERSREFLEHIVEKAEEEIGYEIESGMVSMQLMRMPDNSLTITFTDRGEDAIHNMLNQIQNLAGMIDDSNIPDILSKGLPQDKDGDTIDVEDLSEAATDETKGVSMDEFQSDNSITTEKQKKAYREHIKELEKKKKAKEKKAACAAKVFCFDSLHNVEVFAETVCIDKHISSKLYKDAADGKYYLFIKKGKLKFDEYMKLCHQLTEYARLCSQQLYIEQYCKEHFECLISKDAIKILKEY